LDLPPQNNLLPKNFEILPEDASLSDRVKLLKTWDDTEIWYKKDDKFKRPKGIVNFKFYTNDCLFSQTSQGRLFAEVWRQCLDEYLREFTYMASCATLNFDVVVAPDNVEFTWSGFNDSLPVFVIETINRIKAMKSADIKDIFDQKKESMLQEYKNFYLNQTFRLAWG
jgi:secreted Zn-dependent insulinase-like peptidase